MFTRLLINPRDIAAEEARMRAAFAGSGIDATFEANAARVIAGRLRKAPQRYLEFGPYWWGVKAALRELGQVLGDSGNPLVHKAYSGGTAAQCLVAGEMFRELYASTYFRGTNSFQLTEEGLPYVLEDPDMLAVPARA
jgi:hypothetical protein